MKQPDESPPHQKIEARQSDERRSIIEKISRRFLHQARLLQLSAFQQIAKTAATLHQLEGRFKSGAPIRNGRARLSQYRLQNSAHISRRNFIVIKTFRRAQSKILHQKKIDLVAIDAGLLGFPEVSLNESAQTFFFRIQSRRRKLPDLESLDQRVHLIEPAQISLHNRGPDFFRHRFAFGIGRGRNLKLPRQRRIDRIRAASFSPGGGEIGRRRRIQRQSGSRAHCLHSASAPSAQG